MRMVTVQRFHLIIAAVYLLSSNGKLHPYLQQEFKYFSSNYP